MWKIWLESELEWKYVNYIYSLPYLWTLLAKALVSLPRNSCSFGEYRPELAGWK